MKIFLFLIILCSTFTARAAGDWWGKLEGDVGIGQVPLVNPSSIDPPAVYLVIKGQAAKIMYEKMQDPKNLDASKYSCEDGVLTKFVGDLQCAFYHRDESYVCDIGVDLLRGRSVVGRGC
jgi:hypothetical protein